MSGRSVVATLANAVLALSIVLLPWYALGNYVPNGWDATFWARVALVLAVVNLVAARRGRGGSRALAGLVLLIVAARVALPPDFGFDFDGLDVPVARRAGAWIGLAAAAAAFAAAVSQSRRSGPAPAWRAGSGSRPHPPAATTPGRGAPR